MRKKKDILRIMMFIYSTLFYLCRKQRYENNMNPLFDKPFTFDRVIRIVFGILVISGIIYLIALLRNALLPFLIGTKEIPGIVTNIQNIIILIYAKR